MREDTSDKPYQSIHIDDRKGRRLLAVFIFQDDSFQVVDERGDKRLLIYDTRETEKAKMPKVQQKILFPNEVAV